MDALYHQHLVALELQLLSAHLTLACLEIISRQFHLLSPEERIQLLVEQGDIECMQMFEVIVAAFVSGGVLAVKEVVVEGNADRLEAIDGQLHGDPLAGSGLSAAGGSGYQHHLNPWPAGYLVGNLGNLLLLQRLAELD